MSDHGNKVVRLVPSAPSPPNPRYQEMVDTICKAVEDKEADGAVLVLAYKNEMVRVMWADVDNIKKLGLLELARRT